jgi:ATP-dependent Clp protease ATP-binding subunit ClpA
MYERFTPRARWVMEQAGREAKRMEHDYVGTEHVLVALLSDHQGHAHRALKQLLADQRKIALETEKLAERGSHNLSIGKLRQTQHVKNVLQFAHEEAKARQLAHIGTSMILLGLLREEDGIAALVLNQNKITHRGATATFQAMTKAHVDLAAEESAAPSPLKNRALIGGLTVGVLLLVIVGATKALGWW